MKLTIAIIIILLTSVAAYAGDIIGPLNVGTYRIVTAYNAGDESQTDDTPCIAANNKDICKALDRGEKLCAANFVPLGTRLYIENMGVFKVVDRTNRRYKNRVDIAMKKSEKRRALVFGRKTLKVAVLR